MIGTNAMQIWGRPAKRKAGNAQCSLRPKTEPLADVCHTLAEWLNRHAIPVANLRDCCIEYEAALQDVEAALQDSEAEIQALDSIPS